MTYRRVLPRDLFNEANLLKCLGALWLALEDAEGVSLTKDDDGPFEVCQDASSGALYVANVRLTIRGMPVHLTRPLNSRDPWPLYAEPTLDGEWFDTVSVFDDEGNLSDEFERLAGLTSEDCEHCGGDGIEPAAFTHEAGDGEGEDRPCSVCSEGA